MTDLNRPGIERCCGTCLHTSRPGPCPVGCFLQYGYPDWEPQTKKAADAWKKREAVGAAQTRLSSLIEAGVNILIGYGIAVSAQMAIFPQYGAHLTLSDNLEIGALFTVISLIRQYVIRRWFNQRLHQASQRAARAVIE